MFVYPVEGDSRKRLFSKAQRRALQSLLAPISKASPSRNPADFASPDRVNYEADSSLGTVVLCVEQNITAHPTLKATIFRARRGW